MGEIFTHKQAECLRLLKDYISYLALDEKYSHECKYHNNEDACRLHEFLLEQMDRIKEEAEVCGWAPSRVAFTAGGMRHSLLRRE